jgi:hypothetical protein
MTRTERRWVFIFALFCASIPIAYAAGEYIGLHGHGHGVRREVPPVSSLAVYSFKGSFSGDTP